MSTGEQPAQVAAPDPGAAPPPGDGTPRRLNQPWRGWVAGGEVVAGAVAVVFAVVSWHHGIEHLVTSLGGGQFTSTIFSGNFMAIAVGLVTVAGFLVLDAIRETSLAIGTRYRPEPDLGPFVDPDPEPEFAPEPDDDRESTAPAPRDDTNG